jgi:hypothetical protein
MDAPTPSTPEVLCCHDHGCNAEFRGCYRKGNLNRHRRLYHQASGAKIYCCGDTSCNKTFRRQDARLKHHRRHHPQLGAEEAVLRGPRQRERQDETLRDVSSWTGLTYDGDDTR